MATTHITSIRNAIANTVLGSIDVGGAGSVVLMTAADVEVATCDFASKAFADAVNGVGATPADSISPDTDATGGMIAKFKTVNGSGADAGYQGSCGVSGSGADLILTSLNIGAGDTVSITSMTYTAPA